MSSEKELQKRLADLNRKPMANRPKEEADVAEMRRTLRKQREQAEQTETPQRHLPDPILYRRDLPPQAPRQYHRPQTGPPVVLAESVDGSEVDGPLGGKAFVVATDVGAIDERTAGLCEAYEKIMLNPASAARQWISDRCDGATVAPQDLVFFDLETTGLASSPLFLIGAMYSESGRLIVRQYFARTYAEERAVITLFLQSVAGRKMLVSFNGKSFDLPYVRVRSAATRVPFDLAPPHFDLLHVSRRIWKGRLPDCRLQTLERLICGRMRHGDIPGEQIPQAYHDYVRTGDARDMVECLKHNLLDLVTLADLMTRLPAPA